MGLVEKFLGGMTGSALGDAIGAKSWVISDGGRERLVPVIEEIESLIYTDDTAMAIGLAESIAAVGEIREQHLGDTFAQNYRREPWRGYAQGPPAIFETVMPGMSYRKVAQRLFGGAGSLGNGAAMRIAPVGLFFYDDPDLYQRVTESAVVTHTHPVGIDGAAVLALAIAEAVKADPARDFPVAAVAQKLVDFARTGEIRDKMAMLQELVAEKVSAEKAADCLGRSITAHESVPFAVYSFLRHWRDYENCLLCAVLTGGDTDTLGAMACAISGAYLGIENIPQAWLKKLENRAHIEGLARKLAEMRTAAFPGM